MRWTEGGSHRTEGCGLGHRLPPSMSNGASQGVCGSGGGWVPRKGEWGSKARGEKAPRVPALQRAEGEPPKPGGRPGEAAPRLRPVQTRDVPREISLQAECAAGNQRGQAQAKLRSR